MDDQMCLPIRGPGIGQTKLKQKDGRTRDQACLTALPRAVSGSVGDFERVARGEFVVRLSDDTQLDAAAIGSGLKADGAGGIGRSADSGQK
jgi:hypothetical protein